jgi:hypothetical protein
MHRIKKHLIGFNVLMFMVLLITLFHQYAFAQADTCSEPKVAVVMEVIEIEEGEFIKHLNEQYPFQPKGSWLYQIQEKVLEELKMNSPGTQFIPASGGIPEDCDYYFSYTLSLIAAGEDIEVAGLKQSEYTAYYMSSRFSSHPRCGKGSRVLGVEITKDEDVNHTIEQNIAAHGNIGKKVQENEESHLVPPRGPEIEISQDREYVSPLEEERKLKIKIDVMNCKGEPVYDPEHGQEVTLPKKTGRGELKCTNGFPEGCIATSNALTLIIQKPIGASATYTLKKGVNAEKVPIKILTCGIDNKVVKEAEIKIHGLELKVKPEKKEIFPGEETKITVKLSEVNVNGEKQPVAGKHIQVQLKGLINGHIHPSGDVTTNQNGKAILTYSAGDKDKKVVLKAKFQPKNFSESVRDESIVAIAHYEGQLVLSYSYDDDCKHEDVTVLVSFGKAEMSFSPSPNQLSTYYPIESVNIIKAKAISTCEGEMKTGNSFHIPTEPWAQVGYGNIILLKDIPTGKITDIIFTTGSSVEFTWSDGTNEIFSGTLTDELYKVSGGDGLYNFSGGEGTFHWRLHRRKSH